MSGAILALVLCVAVLAGCSKRNDDYPEPVLIDRPAAGGALTVADQHIQDILIRQSRASYSGRCACPDDRRMFGRRCGAHSAYSKGEAVLCYPSDVTPDMIMAYKATH